MFPKCDSVPYIELQRFKHFMTQAIFGDFSSQRYFQTFSQCVFFHPRTGSLIIDFEVIFTATINEALASLETAFKDSINGSLLGTVAEVRLSGNNRSSDYYIKR